jgi:hypothetical protein
MSAWAPTRGDEADLCDLPQAECRVFGFEIDNKLP